MTTSFRSPRSAIRSRRDRAPNCRRDKRATLHFEQLENRELLAAQPVLPEWLITAGGSTASDLFVAPAIHSSGDLVVTARFSDTVDFDPGPAKAELTSAGGSDIAVARYTAAGELVWVRRFGGPAGDLDVSIDLDAAGNAYVAAVFHGSVDIGGTQFTADSAGDGLLFKLDDAGSVVWARQFAAGSFGPPRALTGAVVDDRDANPAHWSVFAYGNFTGTGQFGSQTFTANGRDAFVSKLTADGEFLWTQVIGGNNNQTSAGITLATSGDSALYVTAQSETVTTVKGTTQTTVNHFLRKLNPMTGGLVWERQIPLATSTSVNGTLAANATNVFVGGTFTGTQDFDPGPGVFNLTSAGDQDGAILNLDSAGNFVWARRLGGTGVELLHGLALSTAGNLFATGKFDGTADFGAQQLTAVGGRDGYLAQLDGSGNFITAIAFPDKGNGVAVDVHGNVYVAGDFLTSDTGAMARFPTGDRVASQGIDAVLLKFSPNAPPIDPMPRIDVFTASPGSVLSGDTIKLRVRRVHDPDVRFHTVNFYRDNGDGVFNAADDVLVGVDTDSAGGWNVSTSTSGLATGDVTYFAEGTALDGAPLDVASVSVQVQGVEAVSYGSTVPVQIRDRSTITSTITVPDSLTVLDIDVALNITHTFNADLTAFLIGPDGTRVQLFAKVGGSGDNFTGTIFDDEAATAITAGVAPFSGRFRPQGSLSAFDGKNAAGTWTLEITDDARKNTGTLNSWSLHLSRAVTPAVLTATSIETESPSTDSAGSSRLFDAAAVDQLLAEPQSTWKSNSRIKLPA